MSSMNALGAQPPRLLDCKHFLHIDNNSKVYQPIHLPLGIITMAHAQERGQVTPPTTHFKLLATC
jgi:hypothetical protein